MIKLLIPTIIFGCFMVLASYSYGKMQPYKMVTVWKTHEAALLADVYGLTPDNVAEPITLWRKRPLK